MPLRQIDVKSNFEHELPQKLPEKLPTISDGIYDPDPRRRLVYRDKVSWFAILYRSVPESVNVAGIKYACNAVEFRWRRYFILIFYSLYIVSFSVTFNLPWKA